MSEGDTFNRRGSGDPLRGSNQPNIPNRSGTPRAATPVASNEFPGHQHLVGFSTEERLERLLRTDPFELRVTCRRELTSQALLLDEARLFMRATARMAHEAEGYAGHPPLVLWVERIVESSIRALLREDHESTRLGLLPDATWDPTSRTLLEVLPIEPSLAQAVCVSFNGLNVDDRRAFQALVLSGQPLEEYAARTGLTRERLRTSVRSTLAVLCRPNAELDLRREARA